MQSAVTVALLALLFRRFDWARFSEVLHHMSPAFYAGSLMAVAVGQALYAFRWWVVLDGIGVRIPYGEALRQFFIGLFFSNLMPTAVGGDAAKVYYLGRRVGYVPVGASVFLDRFLGFLWLAVLGATLAWMVGSGSPILVLNRNLLTMFAAAFVAAVIIARVVPIERLLARVVPARWAALAGRLSEFAARVRDGGNRPATIAVAGAVVLVYSWLVTMVYLQYFAANALPAIATLPVMLIVVSMGIFVNVPVTVNGIGLREQLHVLLFSSLGVPREVAVWISLLLFSHFLVLSLVGWGLWLRIRPAAAATAI